jgi:hypothetical protein
LGYTVTLRAKKRKNLSSARHYDQIRFRFHTAKTRNGHRQADFACDAQRGCYGRRGQWIWAAKRATVTIPIVFPVAVDLVGSGFVDNLSRTLTRLALRMGADFPVP